MATQYWDQIISIKQFLASATRSNMGATLTGTDQRWGAAPSSVDSKIYCTPHNATDILIIDPAAGTATLSTMGATLTGTFKWRGMAEGSDGKLYCAPRDATDILIIDPGMGTATRSTMGASLTGTNKWSDICAGSDGKLYCAPADAADILVIDPVVVSATRETFGLTLTDTDKWINIVRGTDGKLYCMPHSATDILIIDPGMGTATRSTMGATLTGTNKWFGMAAGSDGKLYGAPRSVTDILIIDPGMGTATRSTMGATLTGTNKWRGMATGSDGKLYTVPHTSTDILIINPVTGTATRSNLGTSLPGATDGWRGAVGGSDGKVYGVPGDAPTDILIITPGPIPWTPEAITTSMWIDFSDEGTVTLVSGVVSQVADKSGNGNNISQGTAAARPAYSATINGLKVATFDGVDDSLFFSEPFLQVTHSLFVVCAMTSEAATGSLVGQWTSGATGRFVISTNQDCSGVANPGRMNPFNASTTSGVCGGAGAGLMVDFSFVGGATTLVESISTTGPSGWNVYRDGSVVSTGTVSSLYQGVDTALGRYSASVASNYYDGKIAEVIIVNSVVDLETRQKIEGYLAHKWGNTNELPSNHPYKTYRPIV